MAKSVIFHLRRSGYHSLLASFFLLGLFSAEVVANGEHGVNFLYPRGGETFYFSDVVNVTYTSPFSSPTMWTFCSTGGGTSVKFIKQQDAPANNGSVLVSMNFASTEECWLDLRPTQEGGNGANSDHFSLLSAQREPTTLGLLSSTVTVSSSTATAAETTGSAEPSANTNGGNSNSGNSGLSTAAIAGICTGFAVLALLLGGMGVAFWFRRRKQKDQQQNLRNTVFHYGNDGGGEKPAKHLQPDGTYRPFSGSPSDGVNNGQSQYNSPNTPAELYGQNIGPNSNLNTPAAYYSHQPSGDIHLVSELGHDGQPTTANAHFHTLYELPSGGPGSHTDLYPGIVVGHTTGSTTLTNPNSVSTAAELPSREAYHGHGNEQEMAAIPPPPHSTAGAEQKFLMQDMGPDKSRQQRSQEMRQSVGGGHYVAAG